MGPGAVHVWRADGEGGFGTQVEAGFRTQVEAGVHISVAEHRRARAFRSPERGRAFARSRQGLRRVLAAYTGEAPAALSIAVDERGKPYLPGHPALRFNLSHTDSIVLYAIAWDRPVGVDVERVREVAYDAIARRFFTPGEHAVLVSLAPGARPATFFAAWTRKEAFLKAKGGGVASGLDGFEVEVRPGHPARVLTIGGSAAEASDWWMTSLDVGPAHAAAVVAARPVNDVRLYDLGEAHAPG